MHLFFKDIRNISQLCLITAHCTPSRRRSLAHSCPWLSRVCIHLFAKDTPSPSLSCTTVHRRLGSTAGLWWPTWLAQERPGTAYLVIQVSLPL